MQRKRTLKAKSARFIALLCAVCMLGTIVPFSASAESGVKVEVTDVANDIITISGTAPTDSVVTIKILNPGVKVSDTLGESAGAA